MFIFLTMLISVSCQKTPESLEVNKSELIMKINAVQEQIMAQGNITSDEEEAIRSLCSIMTHDDGLANFSPSDRMILKDVDMAPVFEDCENLSKLETQNCFDQSISEFFNNEFNLIVSQKLNLSEPKQVEVFFIIDDTGHLTGMKVRNSEVTIQAEILRVLRKMPVIKPAIHNGESVSTLCSILVVYGNELDIDVTHIPERPND